MATRNRARTAEQRSGRSENEKMGSNDQISRRENRVEACLTSLAVSLLRDGITGLCTRNSKANMCSEAKEDIKLTIECYFNSHSILFIIMQWDLCGWFNAEAKIEFAI